MKRIDKMRQDAARITSWSVGRKKAYYDLPEKIRALAWEQDRDIRYEGDGFMFERGYYECIPEIEEPIFLGTSIAQVINGGKR